MDDGNTSMKAVVDTLKASGVADKDVQTTDLSMNPEYAEGKGQPARLTGYRVSQTVSVTVEDFDKASDIVTAALTAGGSGVRLNGLRLQVGDPDGSLEPARKAAMEQAREKAEEYADGGRPRLGDVVTISEAERQPASSATASTSVVRSRPECCVPVPGRQQDLTANIVVVYQLK